MSEFIEIKGFPGYFINKSGAVIGKKGHVLTQSLNVDGYPVVYVRLNGKNCCKRVHRFLAEAFIPNPDELPIVNHIDGDKENYSLSNLEWTTVKGNSEHATKILGVNKGRRNFSEEQINQVCSLMEKGYSNKDICKITGVSIDAITKVKAGASWLHISCKYNITYTKSYKFIDNVLFSEEERSSTSRKT